jgi:hypothetical protein
MIIPSSSWASSMTRIGLTAITAAIAVILLTANITIINAQQQSLTSQPSAIEDGTAAGATTFQSTTDSFRVQVPEGWVIRDLNNTDSALLEETRQGYGILAQLCPEEELQEQQQQQGAAASLTNASGDSSSNTLSCDPSESDVIHIVRYPDLDTRLLSNNVTFDDNMTTDNILSYHLQKLQEVGYRSIQIVNSTDMALNLTNPQTNETIATVPAKLVEMTYSTNFAPNETRTGYFISTATNATTPNPGTTKGYSVFYEGNSTTNTTTATTAAEITTATAPASSNLLPTPLPPAVGQVFDSFELIAAPEVVAQEEAQTAETTQGGDFNDGNDTAVVEEDDDIGADEDDDDGGDTSCHPSYPDTCIPPPPPNLNCDDVEETNFEVVGSDPHGFDGDNDGVGCEDGDGNGGDDDGGNGGENNPDEFEDDDGGNGGDEGEGGGEGNDPNEFEGCIVPPGRDPGDVGC